MGAGELPKSGALTKTQIVGLLLSGHPGTVKGHPISGNRHMIFVVTSTLKLPYINPKAVERSPKALVKDPTLQQPPLHLHVKEQLQRRSPARALLTGTDGCAVPQGTAEPKGSVHSYGIDVGLKGIPISLFWDILYITYREFDFFWELRGRRCGGVGFKSPNSLQGPGLCQGLRSADVLSLADEQARMAHAPSSFMVYSYGACRGHRFIQGFM